MFELALQSLISIALLAVLVLYFYNGHRVDRLRQDLFGLRDQLFDEAARGNVSFDSRCYIYTRTVINGMIRFGHRVSIARLIIAAIILKDEQRQLAKDIQEHEFAASPERERACCAHILSEANRLIVRHLGASPFLAVVLLPAWILALWGFSVTAWFVRTCAKLFARFDQVAFEEGRRAAGRQRDTAFG